MSSRRLKYLIKSKSLSFVMDLKDKSQNISSIIWNDSKVFYRTSSSDMILRNFGGYSLYTDTGTYSSDTFISVEVEMLMK